MEQVEESHPEILEQISEVKLDVSLTKKVQEIWQGQPVTVVTVCTLERSVLT